MVLTSVVPVLSPVRWVWIFNPPRRNEERRDRGATRRRERGQINQGWIVEGIGLVTDEIETQLHSFVIRPEVSTHPLHKNVVSSQTRTK